MISSHAAAVLQFEISVRSNTNLPVQANECCVFKPQVNGPEVLQVHTQSSHTLKLLIAMTCDCLSLLYWLFLTANVPFQHYPHSI